MSSNAISERFECQSCLEDWELIPGDLYCGFCGASVASVKVIPLQTSLGFISQMNQEQTEIVLYEQELIDNENASWEIAFRVENTGSVQIQMDLDAIALRNQ